MTMNVRLAVANAIIGKVEQATTVDRYLLSEDDGFTKLLTNIINGNLKELSINQAADQLTAYVNNNYQIETGASLSRCHAPTDEIVLPNLTRSITNEDQTISFKHD